MGDPRHSQWWGAHFTGVTITQLWKKMVALKSLRVIRPDLWTCQCIITWIHVSLGSHPVLAAVTLYKDWMDLNNRHSGSLGGSVIEHLPSAQVVLDSQDPGPHRAPCRETASPSTCVSASVSVSLMNK